MGGRVRWDKNCHQVMQKVILGEGWSYWDWATDTRPHWNQVVLWRPRAWKEIAKENQNQNMSLQIISWASSGGALHDISGGPSRFHSHFGGKLEKSFCVKLYLTFVLLSSYQYCTTLVNWANSQVCHTGSRSIELKNHKNCKNWPTFLFRKGCLKSVAKT